MGVYNKMMMTSDADKRDSRLRWLAIALGVIGISIQLFILYPWHIEISNEIKTLTKKIMCK